MRAKMTSILLKYFLNIINSSESETGILFVDDPLIIKSAPHLLDQNKLIFATMNKDVENILCGTNCKYVYWDNPFEQNTQIKVHYFILKSIILGLLTDKSPVSLLYNTSDNNNNVLEWITPCKHLPEIQLFVDPNTSKILNLEVFLSVLDLSIFLGSVRHPFVKGTMITVGDHKSIQSFSKPFLFEPFHFYPDDQKNIFDKSIWKTIERYSRLDAAFILTENGVIHSIVEMITPPKGIDKGESGLGSRHRSAASISNQTNAYVFVISQTAGNVSLFIKGQKVFTLTLSNSKR